MVNVERYLELPIGRESDNYVDLLARVPGEARYGEIALSSEFDASASSPAYLTGQMGQWYRSRIAGERSSALGEVEGHFKQIKTRQGQEGLFLEAEIDRHAQEKWANIKAEYEQFMASMEVGALQEKLEDTRDSYERKRAANGGEDSRAWNRWLYVLSLMVIAIPELFLNFESMSRTLRSFGLESDALATGLTLAVMFSIAMSSHVIGITIHQWGDRFGGFVSRSEKWRHGRFFAVGWMLFGVAISLIAYGRYQILADEIERAMLTGRSTGVGAIFQIGYTVGGNVLIWLLGIVLSMLAHDRVDGLGEAKRAYDYAARKYAQRHRAEIEDRKERHINLEQRKNANLREFEKRALRPLPEYMKLRRLVDDILAKDSEVLSVLEDYRLTLLNEIEEYGGNSEFVVADVSSVGNGGSRALSPSQYRGLKLYLPRAEG